MGRYGASHPNRNAGLRSGQKKKKEMQMQVCDLQLVTGHVNNNKKRLRLLQAAPKS
jgi:hypothetical protein